MCDDRERLIGYVYGECDAREQQEIEAHVATCDMCRDELGGLRSTRADLLSWDVPEHGSVWTPFVKTRPVPFWRAMPAWGLAAAASLVFVVGAAGGIATTALMAPKPVVQTAGAIPAVERGGASAVPTSLTQADLDAFQARMLATMRSEMDQRLVSSHAQVKTLIGQSEERQRARLLGVNNDLVRAMEGTTHDIEALRAAMQQYLGGR